MKEDWQGRTRLLIGDQAVDYLVNLHIVVAGIGGVGGHVAEALARAGIGHLTLIDHDRVSISNRNRQLVALTSTQGQAKVDVMRQRIAEINPNAQVTTIEAMICEDAYLQLQQLQPDAVVDAIDSVSCKVALLKASVDQGIPIYSSMGAGRRLDASAVRVMDVMDTQGCGLARAVRQRLRKVGVGRGIRCVVSTELPISPVSAQIVADERLPNGTISYMPAVFGILLAGELLRDRIHTVQQVELTRTSFPSDDNAI